MLKLCPLRYIPRWGESRCRHGLLVINGGVGLNPVQDAESAANLASPALETFSAVRLTGKQQSAHPAISFDAIYGAGQIVMRHPDLLGCMEL